jgi:hypothetical protein
MQKAVNVVAKRNIPLNELADYVFENAADLIDRLDVFHLVVGSSSLLAGGEPPIKSIRIVAVIDHPEADFKDDLETIILLLEQRASELEIELEFDRE